MSEQQADPEWCTSEGYTTTYWRAGYTLDGAEPVVVGNAYPREKVAAKAAEEALSETLEKVRALGLCVSGEAWVVEHQSRRQVREWPPTVTKELEVKPWGGRLAVTLKGMEYPS